jgi:hypothetical protein
MNNEMTWQPIETAPRGSGINGPQLVIDPGYVKPPLLLLWLGDDSVAGYYDWVYHKGYGRLAGERKSAWCDHNGYEINPTHWMPLPGRPEADKGDAQSGKEGYENSSV